MVDIETFGVFKPGYEGWGGLPNATQGARELGARALRLLEARARVHAEIEEPDKGARRVHHYRGRAECDS